MAPESAAPALVPNGSGQAKSLTLPRLYPILDVSLLCRSLPAASDAQVLDTVCTFATELLSAGITLLQYRGKNVSPREMLAHARELRRMTAGRATLIMNDRPDLCVAAGFDGVHVGQSDLSPKAARLVVGGSRIVGVSTHNIEQAKVAHTSPADYIAIGPVFGTTSKDKPDPVVGLDGVRTVRALTQKPLVAIGGISRATCRSVIDAGADSVAIISDLIASPKQSAEEFLRVLG